MRWLWCWRCTKERALGALRQHRNEARLLIRYIRGASDVGQPSRKSTPAPASACVLGEVRFAGPLRRRVGIQHQLGEPPVNRRTPSTQRACTPVRSGRTPPVRRKRTPPCALGALRQHRNEARWLIRYIRGASDVGQPSRKSTPAPASACVLGEVRFAGPLRRRVGIQHQLGEPPVNRRTPSTQRACTPVRSGRTPPVRRKRTPPVLRERTL